MEQCLQISDGKWFSKFISIEFCQTINKMYKYKDIIRHARTHTIVLSHILSCEVIWECAPVKGGSKPKYMSQKK